MTSHRVSQAVSPMERATAALGLQRGTIGMADYLARSSGKAITQLTWTEENGFTDMTTGRDAGALARRYSRAKHGSIEDIRFFAAMVIGHLEASLDDAGSDWRHLFEHAKAEGESVAMMTTGWRNVPSTANVLYGMVVEHINVKLAHMGLPTIIDVKLPRIAPPCENYASLTTEERQRISLTQDHVIPDRNFYRWSAVHVIFGDDVLVTGSTAGKVFSESMRNGAKSFRAMYPVALDPVVALRDPALEERLNGIEVTGELDDVVVGFLAHPGNVPILRALRLVFSAHNVFRLASVIDRVPARNWLSLYVAALGNEFLRQAPCVESLELLKRHLIRCNVLDANGCPAADWLDARRGQA